CRRIQEMPDVRIFKPAGIPFSSRENITLGLDELEALRLADMEGLYQEKAASLMNVSRQTFGRIVTEARRKVAEAIIEGKMLIIEGGNFEMATTRTFKCYDCGHQWDELFGTGRPQVCPSCKSINLHRFDFPQGGPGIGGRCRRRGFGLRGNPANRNRTLKKGVEE
ncbi:MAG: DUF134 domain-containing protein, partial [Candidatus Glassbacteria bacterium]